MPQAALGLRAALDSVSPANRVIIENSSNIAGTQIRGIESSHRDVDTASYQVDGRPNNIDNEDDGNETEEETEMDAEGPSNSRTALEAYTDRLNTAKVRAEFEASLMTLLTLNVLYMYYVDHKLIVLFIRATQVVRLLYYPFASEATQRSTSVLVVLTNIMVVLIHIAMVLQNEQPVRMLFINFIGPEPKAAYKVVFLDSLIITLQALLLQCRAEASDRILLTRLPVPVPRGDGPIPSNEPEEEVDTSSLST